MQKKARLREKLIVFQKQLMTLSGEVRSGKQQCQDEAEALFLDLCDVLDAFENVFARLEEQESSLDASMQRTLKSFQAIHRKVLRILEERGVTPIELLDSKASMELCQVVETREDPDQEEGTVLATIRNGYRQGPKVLRPVEVVTVAPAKRGPAS